MWNPVREAEKAAKRAVNKIVNPAVDACKRGMNKLGDQLRSGIRDTAQTAEAGLKRGLREAEGGIKSVAHEAEGSLRRVEGEIEDGVRNVGREVEEGLTEKLPEMVEDAIEDALKAAASEAVQQGLNAALDVIELGSPNTLGLTFGFEAALVLQAECTVRIVVVNPVSKLTEIRKWAANPPKGRSQIIACFKDFGPQSFEVAAKFSGNGPDATWSGEDKYDKLDAFLAKRGL